MPGTETTFGSIFKVCKSNFGVQGKQKVMCLEYETL